MSAVPRTVLVLVIALASLPVASLAQRGRGSAPAPAPAPAQTPPKDAPKPTATGGTQRGGSGARGTPSTQEPGSKPQEPGEPSTEPMTPADRAADYFKIADYNADGHINYDEAQRSLRADKAGFAVYDKDIDGHISAEEFAARFEAVLELGGAFPPPVKKPDSRKPPRRDAKELLETYDSVPDKALDEAEVRRAMSDYGVTTPEPPALLATLDRDSSRKLEIAELEKLAEILSPSETGEVTTPRAMTVLELFGKRIAREEHVDATYIAAQIPGPVPVFRRLDHDDDGQVTLIDLVELQRPMQVHVRGNAVFAVLDSNHDGELSEDEFLAALQPRKP